MRSRDWIPYEPLVRLVLVGHRTSCRICAWCGGAHRTRVTFAELWQAAWRHISGSAPDLARDLRSIAWPLFTFAADRSEER